MSLMGELVIQLTLPLYCALPPPHFVPSPAPLSLRRLQERRENFLLRGQLSVLTPISVSVPPPKQVKVQVAAKHTRILRM